MSIGNDLIKEFTEECGFCGWDVPQLPDAMERALHTVLSRHLGENLTNQIIDASIYAENSKNLSEKSFTRRNQ